MYDYFSPSGNYWNDYDSEAEGCFDANSDIICDDPYNISHSNGSIVNKDHFPFTIPNGWEIGLQIIDATF